LQQQQVEASDAVEQWSARFSELDSLKSELESNLETVSKERDELSGMLQYERENGGKEVLAQIEIEHKTERAKWDAEKERLQARIDEQNESLLVSTQNVNAANEELSQMKATAAETIDAWKSKFISSIVYWSAVPCAHAHSDHSDKIS
jgi:chromosome segregation ATPase